MLKRLESVGLSANECRMLENMAAKPTVPLTATNPPALLHPHEIRPLQGEEYNDWLWK
jgi:hypothetical protein